MNLYHLRYFCDTGSIWNIIQSCGCSGHHTAQPKSRDLFSEEELGVKLFENGRNVSLTKYGKSFLEDVEQTFEPLDSSVNGLQLAGKRRRDRSMYFSQNSGC